MALYLVSQGYSPHIEKRFEHIFIRNPTLKNTGNKRFSDCSKKAHITEYYTS